jgi:DNA-binding MarR family transcriptional regulator
MSPASKSNLLFSELFAEGNRSFANRWKHPELFEDGFVAVPNAFLRHYAHLKPHRLTLGEVLFVLHLMEFKWDQASPFPGYGTIAKRMGVSDKMARRHARSLEDKKYLRREIRTGSTNRFDLSPLFDALLRAVQTEKKSRTAKKQTKGHDKTVAWFNRLIDAFEGLAAQDKAALNNWESENPGAIRSDWPGWEKLIGKRPDG